jgi:RNA polymerase sigma factor for flagellar operon FliA
MNEPSDGSHQSQLLEEEPRRHPPRRPPLTGVSSRTRRGEAARNALVEQYLPLVRHVVARLPVTPPRGMDREDLHGAGVFGLIQAASTWDENRGASFKTFAYTAIRGAVLDEIRRHDPVSRPRRERLREFDRASATLRESIGRTPTLEEIASHLEIPASALESDLDILHGSRTVSIEDLAGTGPHDDGSTSDVPDEDATDEPYRVAERRDQVDALTAAIADLPEQDRRVVILYHHEGLFLKEIGDMLGVTESRVCQILSKATKRLRARLQDREDA